MVLLTLLIALSSAPQTWTSGEYRYDGAGNVVAIGDRAYGYDAVSRLTKAQTGAAYEYEYDAYGNRTAYRVNQQRVAVPVNAANNRLADATYDAAGNQLSRGATAATFDGFGMMTSYRFDAVNAQTFVYNANDERIGLLRGGEWTWSLRDAGGRVLRQYRSSSTNPSATWVWIEDFVYRGSLLLGSERTAADGGRRHHHLDHLGSPRLVTSDPGSIVSEHDFLPFGEERTPLGQQIARGFDREPPHRFTGHERDFDIATPNATSSYIDYMHARYYATATGRFLSVDPKLTIGRNLSEPQRWNRYSYVVNNPLKYVDRDGRDAAVAWRIAWVVAPSAARWLGRTVVNGVRETAIQRLSGYQYGRPVVVPDLVQPLLSEGSNKTIDDILSHTRPGRETKGRTTQHVAEGGIEQAVRDFHDLVTPGSVRHLGGGVLVGSTPEGETVAVYPNSSDGRATVDIQDGKKHTKIRYNEAEEDADGNEERLPEP